MSATTTTAPALPTTLDALLLGFAGVHETLGKTSVKLADLANLLDGAAEKATQEMSRTRVILAGLPTFPDEMASNPLAQLLGLDTVIGGLADVRSTYSQHLDALAMLRGIASHQAGQVAEIRTAFNLAAAPKMPPPLPAEEEVAAVAHTNGKSDPLPLLPGYEDTGTIEITPPGGVKVVGAILPLPGWAQGQPLVYRCHICNGDPVQDADGALRCPSCNPEPTAEENGQPNAQDDAGATQTGTDSPTHTPAVEPASEPVADLSLAEVATTTAALPAAAPAPASLLRPADIAVADRLDNIIREANESGPLTLSIPLGPIVEEMARDGRLPFAGQDEEPDASPPAVEEQAVEEPAPAVKLNATERAIVKALAPAPLNEMQLRRAIKVGDIIPTPDFVAALGRLQANGTVIKKRGKLSLSAR